MVCQRFVDDDDGTMSGPATFLDNCVDYKEPFVYSVIKQARVKHLNDNMYSDLMKIKSSLGTAASKNNQTIHVHLVELIAAEYLCVIAFWSLSTATGGF